MADGRGAGVHCGSRVQRPASYVRFSLGFYAGRVFSIITSSIVLIVMLAETTRLYMRLARSNAMLRRERDNKLMNLEAMAASISHEVRQPIAAMSANSGAAIRFIQREPVDRAAALSALMEVKSDCRRADQILQDIRALFGKGDQGQERIDVNETARAGLWALRGAFNEHGVSVRSELNPDVPPSSATGVNCRRSSSTCCRTRWRQWTQSRTIVGC